LPAKLLGAPTPLESIGRNATAVIGVLLLSAFFLPMWVMHDGTLKFGWQAAPVMPPGLWRLLLWTFCLGVLATAAGVLTSGALRGIVLASGIAATFIVVLLEGGQQLSGLATAATIYTLTLMTFLATLRLRLTFPRDGGVRLLLGVAAGAVFLSCLLPVDETIAIQHALNNAASAPEAGLIFASLAASLLALISIAPQSEESVSVLAGFAVTLICLGLIYVPVRLFIHLFPRGAPAMLIVSEIVLFAHVCLRVFGFLLLGTTAVALLLGIAPALRAARREAPLASLLPRAPQAVTALCVTAAIFALTLITFGVTDSICRKDRAEQHEQFIQWPENHGY